MDDLGQGIDRSGEKPLFIAKTLPGERGTIQPYKEAKGVAFGRLETPEQLTEQAPNRIAASCPHYDQCPGCQYLHTDYESEADYKQQAFQRSLRALKNHPKALPEVQWVAAPQRLQYRNRIQLHYRHRYLGLIDGSQNQVVEIPQCQLIEASLKPAFEQLYQSREHEHKTQRQGHVEIYRQPDGEIRQEWDQPYAAGGFTQVNEDMHQALLQSLQQIFQTLKNQSLTVSGILDCFAGNGNLSAAAQTIWPGAQRECLDRYHELPNASDGHFLSLDLHDDAALSRYRARRQLKRPNILLVDPPRAGFPALPAWIKTLKPDYLIYVACEPKALIRDLSALPRYRIEQLWQLDLFPSTHHYESVALVRLRDQA